MRHDSTTLA